MARVRLLKLPNYIDILLMINTSTPRTRINKLLNRSECYIITGLKFLESNNLISISNDSHRSDALIITLTSRGVEVQNLVKQLYSAFNISYCLEEVVVR